MIQYQDWAESQEIIIADEMNHGTVQVEIPKPGRYKDEYYQNADGAIHNLWVDKGHRRFGWGNILLETAEREAKKMGCKSVQLEWNGAESERFVLDWYQRNGYRAKAFFGLDHLLLVKNLDDSSDKTEE